jgi:transcriptional regulator
MYSPEYFKVDDPEKIYSFIRRYSFGILVSNNGSLQASHLPFLLEESNQDKVVLISHMAKANDQWKSLENQEVMTVFNGPHAYISPAWYEAKEVVPTWNYAAVHVYGKYVPITDEQEWKSVLDKMVRFYETSSKKWSLDSLPEDFFEKLKHMTSAFKIEINRIEGKWKLSQNHTEERREKVIHHLERGGFNEKAIADLMKERQAK